MEVSPPPNIIPYIFNALTFINRSTEDSLHDSMIIKQLESGHCDVIIILLWVKKLTFCCNLAFCLPAFVNFSWKSWLNVVIVFQYMFLFVIISPHSNWQNLTHPFNPYIHQLCPFEFTCFAFSVLLCLKFVLMRFLILRSDRINRTGCCSAPT